MGERRGMKALEMWCKRVTDGYEGVKVEDMSKSWRDGLAFCAIIHHFRPELIDFASLNKADIYRNNELAFRTAELHLGIPALLDAEDMVEFAVPDRLSILTYLSQFYQTFAGSRQSTSPSPNRTPPVGKRPASPSVLSPTLQSTPSKMLALGSSRREPCTKCNLPVFIAERLLVGGRKLYHRTCFRCARCQHQLSLANCYETEDGQYCCEACPDEVDTKPVLPAVGYNDDEYSADFETVLESSSVTDRPLSIVNVKQDVVSSKAMADFMIGQLQCTDEEMPTSLPLNSEQTIDKVSDTKTDTCTLDSVSSSHVNSTPVSLETSESDINSSVGNLGLKKSTYFFTKTNSPQAENDDSIGEEVPLIESSIKRSDSNQPLTANNGREDCIHDQNKLITKCTKESGETPTSLVKMRMRMFDNDQKDNTPKINFTSRRSINLYSKPDEHVEDYSPNTDTSTKGVNVIPLTEMNATENGDNDKNLTEETRVLSKPDNKKDEEPLSTPTMTVERIDFEIGNETLDIMDEKEINKSITLITKEEVIVADVDYVSKSTEELGNVDIKIDENNEVILEPNAGKIKETLIVNSGDTSFLDKSLDESISSTTASAVGLEEVNVSSAITDDICSDKPEIVIDNDVKIDTTSNETSPRKDSKIVYPTDLNPFGDEESEEEEKASLIEAVNLTSTNPFGSSDEEENPLAVSTPNKTKPPRPPLPVLRQTLPTSNKKVVDVPKISVNPFWSDGEEPSSEDEAKPKRTPVPRPRMLTVATTPDPSPVPRLRSSSGKFGSANSLSSVDSSRGSTMRRKKKPAPPPPLIDSAPPLPNSAPPLPDYALPLPDSAPPLPNSPPPLSGEPPSTLDHISALPDPTSLLPVVELSSPSRSIPSSPKTLPRHRKARPAPPPPSDTISKSDESKKQLRKLEVSPPIECEKFEKDEANRNRQSKTSDESPFMIAANKSMYGQWKRKKGPAPPRPVPQRREIRAMPMKEVKRELDDIDVQQLELERQGVKLEKTIRTKCEDTPPAEESTSGITVDVEDLVLQLFEIVNEKNELFRRQAELMYLRRQHRLEEEHADLEYEIRCLLERPEHTKTDTEKAYEEELISRLVDVVERRDEIVNCLEMDRQREVEEDRSIHEHLATFTAKGKGVDTVENHVEAGSTNTHKKSNTLKLLKKKVKKSKDKLIKKKEVTSIDADKDIDESDVTKQTKEKKSKHKWF